MPNATLDLKTWKFCFGTFQGFDPALDDSRWEVVNDIEKPRGLGHCQGWYRAEVELPEKVGDFDVAGSKVEFVTNIDDYGEIWVDGQIKAYVAGFNVDQRVVLTENAQPGAKCLVALLAINGPLARPGGAIFVRFARLELTKS